MSRAGRDRAAPPAPEPTAPSEAPERSVVALIRDLQAGTTRGTTLAPEDRRRVVEHLWSEGCTVVDTAEIVQVTERTIARDRAAIRSANALEPHEGLVPEVAGMVLRHADQAVARLRRLARDRETPAPTRVEAELGAWAVMRELVETLQRLGYLPAQRLQIDGGVRVEATALPGIDDLHAELAVLESGLGPEPAPELVARLAEIRTSVTTLTVRAQMASLASATASATPVPVTPPPPASHATP